ncbi:MAG: M23 family metallopeptidase [Deltaproteobacteria bacterium]|nr:M23 family metallopeptidase [Deltaproteobacteria bacterium]
MPLPFDEAMRRILPPRRGRNGTNYVPEITTGTDGTRQDYYAKRPGRQHNGVDMNYHYESGWPVGQSGVNTDHPDVHSPVDGVVTAVDRDKEGMVEITDRSGRKHRLLHMHDIGTDVKSKTKVKAGQKIGTMGGRGRKGANEYPQHVHYSVIGSSGKVLDPETYWNFTVPYNESRAKKSPYHLELDEDTKRIFKGLGQGCTVLRNGETLRREGDQVWRIEPDGSTRGYFISE